MTALELLARLRDKGIRIAACDGELELDAPKGALDAELRTELVKRKPELLQLLSWSRRAASDVALEPVPREGRLPLSWSQQRLWFLDQLEPASSAYNISWTVRLRGELHRAALQTAINQLAARHETLRTTFPDEHGEPFQHIAAQFSISLQQENLAGVGDEQLRARLGQIAAAPFDLAAGPLWRTALLQLADDEHILLVVIHHIVADGASMRVLFRELAAYYDAAVSGVPAVLPDLPVQYADYAVWQRKWLDSAELERQTEYWRRQLEGLPPLLELPWDRPRSAAMRYRGASVLRILPAGLAEGLRNVARSRGCTLFMVMLTAFYVLLQRYTSRDDLAVGTPMGGRPRTGLEGLIGFFINTVVLRTNLGGDPTFEQLLRQVREVALGAHANQELPFEKLVEVLQPQRELSYSPVFQVMFDLQEERRWRLPVKNLEVIPEVVFSSRTSSFDLTLSVRQAENGLDAMFEYDTDLFDESSIERLASHYEHLLGEIVADPGLPLSDYGLIDAAEQRRIVSAWSGVAADYPDTLTLQALVEAQVRQQPDSAALCDVDRSYSYEELNRRANRLAHRLQALGAIPGQPVAILACRQSETFIALLAVLKSGACALPLDPDYPAARLRTMVASAGARLMLMPEVPAGFDAEWADGLGIVKLDEQTLAAPDYAAVNPVSLAGPDSPAFLMFTSGTSGEPKGVALPHRGFVNYLHHLCAKTALGPTDRVLQFAALGFDISIEETFAAWVSGATLVLRERHMNLSVDEFVAGCERHGITWLSLPTAWWHELCTAMERDGHRWPVTVRSVLIGGERARRDAFARWKKIAAGIRLFNTYGPTETSIAATWCELTHLDADKAGELPIGNPVPNVFAWVLDSQLRPLPAGVPGELYIGGVGVADGYWHRPDLSAGRFFRDRFRNDPDARLYRTGDRARYRADGRLMYLGRVDAQLKIRGYRIEPGEIEAVLNTMAGVEGSVVQAWNDPADATAQPRLVAWFAGAADEDAIRSQLRSLLPEYMLPAALIRIDRLPLTVNGKVDYRALPEPEWSIVSDAPRVPPRTATEKTVATIWAEVLGLADIGAHDNFFALGGHSLLATRVVARVRDALHSAVPLRQLFDAPTVAGFAAALDACGRMDESLPLTPRPRDAQLLPLSWTQQRLWVLDQLESSGAAYHLPWMAQLEGALDTGALQAAIDGLLRRHEILRTRFGLLAGDPVQIVDSNVQVRVAAEDCTALTHEQVEARLLALIAQPFDLHHGPLLRVHLLRTADARHVLLVLLHHIVADGWSMNVLFRELAFFYNSALQRRAAELPALPVQYADYALWQRQGLAGKELERLSGYWRTQLADAPPLIELPLDFPRPAVQRYRGAWVNAILAPELLHNLRTLSVAKDASLFMVLLAAFKALLAVHAGSEDIVVGTPVAGRQRTELEGLIGCFLNTLVLRTRLDANPAFTELLARVRQTTLDAYDHQDLPFEKLLEMLQPDRSTAWTPVVQVLFNLHNAPASGWQLEGIEVASFDIDRGVAKFDLSAVLAERMDGLHIGFEYNSDVFAGRTVSAMLDDYLRMLQSVAADPQIQLKELVRTRKPRLPAPVHAFTPWPPQALAGTVADRFAEIVACYPDRPAVDDGEHRWTYRELDRRVAAVARQLHKAAAGARGRIGLMLGHDAPMLAGLLGALRGGSAYVPLDARGPVARNRAIAVDAGLALLLTDPRFAGDAHAVAADLCPVMTLDKTTGGDADDAAEAADRGSADDLAYILFTSGSTGVPKGVMQTQRNLLHHARTYSEALHLAPGDRLTLVANYGFDAAVMDIFGALLNGACLHIIDVLAAAGPDELLEAIHRQRLTVLHATPTVFRYLLESTDSSSHDLGAVRAVVLGGEEASARDFQLFSRRFAADALLINGLGPSESTTALQFFADRHTRLPGHALPVGLPVADTDALVIDATGRPAAIVGELCIRSRYVSVGYQGQPELSAQRFMHDPDEPGVRIYRTGDRLRYLPDGQLVFAGRLDDQVKLRGQRIEPAEIETALLAIAGVRRCAVLLMPGPAVSGGEAERLLVAYVQAAVAPEELRAQLRERLPDAMIPAVFMPVDHWPLLPNGKLDRRALPQPVVQPVTSAEQLPRTAIEQRLHAIWTEVLGMRCGMHDDFFALGGHSLKATRVVARIRDTLQAEIGLRDLFAHPTLAGLAQIVETAAGARDASPVLRPRTGPELPPLSWAQQRLWFLDQLEPESAAYNLHWAARIDGTVDVNGLQQALVALTERHETLRTTFAPGDGAPVQLIARSAGVRVEEEAMPGAGQDRLHARLLDLIRQPFDLRSGPLLRAHLLRASDTHAVLLLVMHHIVADGWSMSVLFRELAILYNAALAGRPAELPPLPVQYADYAVWQRAWLSGGELERQENYWRTQLAGAPPLLDLPLDHVRPPVQRYRGAWVSDIVSAATLQRLRELAAGENATLFMVLLTAFKLVIVRHSGREDILVGTPIAGRRRTALEGLIGFFLNTLVLRTDLSANPTFRSALQRVRATTLAAYDHQELPFEKLLEIVQPVRSMAYTPIVQVMFNLHNEPGGAMALEGASVKPFNVDRGTAKFDLSVAVVEGAEGLQIGFEYNTDLFVRDSIASLLRHYCEVLQAIVIDADTPVAVLPLSANSAEPRPQNDFEPFLPERPGDSLIARFTEVVSRYADRPAVVDAQGCCTYRELDRRSSAVARQVAELARPSSRVGLLLGHDAAMAAGLLGVLKAGCAYVPLDPQAPLARLQTIIADAGIEVLVSVAAFRSVVQALGNGTLAVVEVPDRLTNTHAMREDRFAVPVTGDSLAYILFTSGSTGKPKGVMQTHCNVLHHVRTYTNALHISAVDRLTLFSGYGFDAAVMDIFGALLNGACLHPVDIRGHAHPGEMLDAISAGAEDDPGDVRQGVTILHATPTLFRFLMRHKVCRHDLADVRLVVLGGEEALASDFALFRRHFAPPALFVNGLGPSESTLTAQFFADHATHLPGQIVPVGAAVAETELLLLNEDGTPAGICGELAVRSRYVSVGYWNEPELTRQRFTPAGEGCRLYRTGDRVRRLPDGKFVYLGRMDAQIKVRGHRVEPGEIEAQLSAFDGIDRCAVVLRADTPESQQAEPRLVAYIVASEESAGRLPDRAELRKNLKAVLPEYMVPQAFVWLDELPLLANGKVDRRALPAPDWGRDESRIFVAPRTATEQQLANIWADILGVTQVSVHDDFFELGGHSLMAAQFVARVTESLQVGLPLRRLFDAPTIAGLAEHVDTLQWALQNKPGSVAAS